MRHSKWHAKHSAPSELVHPLHGIPQVWATLDVDDNLDLVHTNLDLWLFVFRFVKTQLLVSGSLTVRWATAALWPFSRNVCGAISVVLNNCPGRPSSKAKACLEAKGLPFVLGQYSKTACHDFLKGAICHTMEWHCEEHRVPWDHNDLPLLLTTLEPSVAEGSLVDTQYLLQRYIPKLESILQVSETCIVAQDSQPSQPKDAALPVPTTGGRPGPR